MDNSIIKKLITILLLIPFWANAQIDWDHVIGGAVVSEAFFWPSYAASNDEDFSCRITCIFGVGMAWAKESFDVLVVENGVFSCKEAGISSGVVIISAFLNRQICKSIKKIKQNKINKRFDTSDNIHYSLDNPIFINKSINLNLK